MLRVVRRSTTGKAAAAFTAVGVLGGLLGGGVNTSTFRKNDLKGTTVPMVPNPGTDTMPGVLRARLDAYFGAHPGALPDESKRMQIFGGEWYLVYQKLSDENTPYELRFSAQIVVPGKKTGFLKYEPSGIDLACQPQPVVASFAEWEIDDYAKAKSTGQAYIEQCAAQFEQALPVWFPERAPAVSAEVPAA